MARPRRTPSFFTSPTTRMVERRRCWALPGDGRALSGGLVDGARTTLYAVIPKAGRLFLMPNACPHEAAAVVRAPKVLIRGELRLADSSNRPCVILVLLGRGSGRGREGESPLP